MQQQRNTGSSASSQAPTHQKMASADEDEYIKMDLSPDPEPIPEHTFTLKNCKAMPPQVDGLKLNSLTNLEDPFSALDTTPVHSVENIYEHIQWIIL